MQTQFQSAFKSGGDVTAAIIVAIIGVLGTIIGAVLSARYARD